MFGEATPRGTTMKTAHERLIELLVRGEVREEEARALLSELERRRAASQDPMSRWMDATQPLLYLLSGAAVLLVAALAVREIRWGKVLARAAALAREDPLVFALLAVSVVLGMYVVLSLVVPVALLLKARLVERRRLRGDGP